MTARQIDRTVGTRAVPDSVRALGSFSDIDYADLFGLVMDVGGVTDAADATDSTATDSTATDSTATPERWARAMFGNVPDRTELLLWRVLLGLRLQRSRSPETVAGWRIGGRGDDWIRLEAASWFLSANLVVRTTDGRVSLATFIRYDRGIGRVVWVPLSAIHRSVVPTVLRNAAARVDRRPSRFPRAETGQIDH